MRAFVVALLVSSAAWAGAAEPSVQTFRGEISDSQCAMNVHSLSGSHAEMLKHHTTGNDPASCVRYCIKHMGGDYVLVSKKNVYRLDKEAMAEPFAAQEVVVHGVLDKKSNTVTVVSIEKDTSAK